MRTIRTKVYTFNELSKEAKEVAIESFRNGLEIHLDFFNDDAEEQIEMVGFYNDIKLRYSLSHCQGDGLSFSCNNIKTEILLKFFAEVLGEGKEKTAMVIIDNCSFENRGNTGRYGYASKNDITFELDERGRSFESNNINKIVSKVEEKIQNHYLDLCNNLEKQGYAEIDYQYSDEAIVETINANDYEFLINGKQF